MAILTTSREFGSGNMEITRTVMASLHYTFVDKEVLFKEIHSNRWEMGDVGPGTRRELSHFLGKV